MHSRETEYQWSIVAPEQFIRATRDSGYKSTASAISELVDNAIQADASLIDITVKVVGGSELAIAVMDNGCGMDAFTLRQALRFGGSNRFDDRLGLGRFGMGLPNSSLSQAKRVTVTSWTDVDAQRVDGTNVIGAGQALQTYLDVDEIANGSMRNVPPPRIVPRPDCARDDRSGTIVVWSCCDRLDFKRPTTICRHVSRELSRRFRYFLEEGVDIRVNGAVLRSHDPMFLQESRATAGARRYGDDIIYQVAANPDLDDSPVGTVRVRFVELPVASWASLSNDEKRAKGIVNSAGVSVVRANREVDFGWYFFGAKRKENYDDWWRCEVSFEPILDEAFGLTHTKQQVKPQQFLIDILTPDLEATARVLNVRARDAHARQKVREEQRPSERTVRANARFLRPIPFGSDHRVRGVGRYRLRVAPLKDGCFFSCQRQGPTFTVTLDPDHAFYRELLGPLRASDVREAQATVKALELLVFAAARAEATMPSASMTTLEQFRAHWSAAMETLMAG